VCYALSMRQTAMLTCSATMFLYKARFANQTAFALAIFCATDSSNPS
jgi:hypothetical protein